MKTKILPLCLVHACLASTVGLFAQSTPVPSNPAGEEVVVLSPFVVNAEGDRGYQASNAVSATRINMLIRDLPFAVQAFTPEFIADQKPIDLYDIVRFSSAVTQNSVGSVQGFNVYTIRGMNSSQALRNGFVTTPMIIDPFNVERVEVVKGPASVLYGQLNPGGVVNVITRRPLSKPAYSLTQRAGSYNHWRTEADLSGPLGNTSFGYRLSTAWQTNESIAPHEKSKRLMFAPVLAWKPTDNLTVTVDYQNFRRDDTAPQLLLPNITFVRPDGGTQTIGPFAFYLGRDFSYAALSDYRDFRVQALNIDVDARLGDGWNARLNFSKSKAIVDQFFSGQAIVVPTGVLGRPNVPNPSVSGTGPWLWRRARQEYSDDRVTQYQGEVSKEFVFGNENSYRLLFGAQRLEPRHDESQRTSSNAQVAPDWDISNPATWNRVNAVTRPQDLATLGFITRQQLTSTGYYFVNSLSLFENRLNVVGGVRRSTSTAEVFNLITGAKTATADSQKTSPQVGASFRLTPGISAYASYSQSFQPQARTLLELGVPTTPAAPLVGKGYDIGFKTELLKGRLSGTLTYFNLENTGIINRLQIFTSGNLVFTDIQSGVDLSRGVEFDATIRVQDNWQVYTSYSYIDAKVKKDLQSPARVGQPLAGSARNMFNVFTKYEFKGDNLEGYYIGGGVNYTSRKAMRPDDNINLYAPESMLVDLLVGRRWKWNGAMVSADLSVKNLLNEDYMDSALLRGEPRRFLASFSAHW